MTIGEFSRKTLLSARALRHYDDVGVLKPALVDATNGYRYYSAEQKRKALLVRRMRDVGLSLEEIARLTDGEPDWQETRRSLDARRQELAAHIEDDRRSLDLVEHWLETGGQEMAFEVVVKDLDPEAVATFRWRGASTDPSLVDVDRWTDLATSVTEAGGTFAGSIGIANVYDVDGIADLELGYVTDELLPPADGYTSRLLDGGEFASVTFDRWSDRVAAYDALDAWLTTTGHRSRGPARERSPLVWPAEPRTPDAVVIEPDPLGWTTEVVLPIA
jgi:DNA-binding transcriptional MerR regulator